MATVSLDAEAIEQLGGDRKTLLDAIDGLRKHGIGRFIDLPQIIVVGDQSSGKSSVLEAISRVRFPVKDGVCTRFATELVLRTDRQTRIHVQVQPASASADPAYTFNETRFDKADLPRIIEEAKTHLLRDGTSFSEDVLRVEICSPDCPHLTLVDLPGFYHSEDADQTADGREIVDRLVETYMARKNSIILAVVSARNQVVMQKVLSKVKAHDKKQERTLGIITKPDLIIPGSQDEDKFIRLAKNEEQKHRFGLGWHVLRNRSEAEVALSPAERDTKEREFFDSSIWSGIPSSNRGADTLRRKLADILLAHIRTNLDTLINDIQGNMDRQKRTLDRLGSPRSSPTQLRAHLDKIASQFQLLSLRAIEGNYTDEFFGGLYPDGPYDSIDDRVQKLRALVRDLNRTFAYVMATKGSRRIIGSDQSDGDKGSIEEADIQRLKLPSFLANLESQYAFDNPEKVTRDAIRAELEPLSSANQGTEFPGTTNDLLAVKLFQDQSRPWEEIARFHVNLLLRVTKSFVDKLVAHITDTDHATCSAILVNIVDPFFEERTSELEKKLQELLYHYRSGYPQPDDAEFRAILSRRRQKHSTSEILQNLLASRPELFTQEGKRQLAGLAASREKSEFGVDSLIDKSETYYELSLRNFTDNVIILAIENCLVKDLPAILTTHAVSQMTDDMLTKLAAESPEIQVERTELNVQYAALRKGLDTCKMYRGRKPIVLPTSPQRAEGGRRRVAPSVETSSDSENDVRKKPVSLPTRESSHESITTTSSGTPIFTPSSSETSGMIGTAIKESLALPFGGTFSSVGLAQYPSSGTFKQNAKSSPSPSAFIANKHPQIEFGKPTGKFDFAASPKIGPAPTSNPFGQPASQADKPILFGSSTSAAKAPSIFSSSSTAPTKPITFGNPPIKFPTKSK
ncbi:P-loop containing nucleoside triphosphate hydrolase protein [Nemania sp. FL0916]|nr:P-loop containing nucleoside triphosphate hydrolase protein [Nemania sp. FL0916]